MLVGGRKCEISVPPGMTFYALRTLLQKVESIAAEIHANRSSRQIDIEDAINKASRK